MLPFNLFKLKSCLTSCTLFYTKSIHKLIQNTGRLHATNIFGPFIGFPLGSKQVISKNIAFGWSDDNPNYSKPFIGAGTYNFDVFFQIDRSKKPLKLLSINHTFSQKVIDDFSNGNAIYNMTSNPFPV